VSSSPPRFAALPHALLLFVLGACASALHEPHPVAQLAPGQAHGRSADQLVREADLAWTHHAAPGQAERAQALYLDAAAGDAHRTDALLGAMRAMSYRIEHEQGIERGDLAAKEVELGQWCQRRDPSNAECDYRLAIALGQQARERKATGHDALDRMVTLLRRTIDRAPRLDSGGPHRVLALVLLRAPEWPVGPGDPEQALTEARAAATAFPASADNQLVLAEALAANDAKRDARAAYERALGLASAARRAGDPEAVHWVAQAQAGLEKTAR